MGNPYFNSLSLPIGSQDIGLPSLNTPKVDTSSLYQPFNQSPSSALSTGMQIPQNLGMSGESSMPLGNESAQNSAQSSQKKQSDLQKAFNSVQALYSPMGGRPIGGSEDVRVKSDAYGRPYTVVSMTPTDAQGKSQKAETLSFGITPEQKGYATGVQQPATTSTQSKPTEATASSVGYDLSDGQKREIYNPFAQQNQAQMAEYNRRKQASMM